MLIINRMACRRVSVPNDDDTAGERMLNVVGVPLPGLAYAISPSET